MHSVVAPGAYLLLDTQIPRTSGQHRAFPEVALVDLPRVGRRYSGSDIALLETVRNSIDTF
jgi:hypothetical protein